VQVDGVAQNGPMLLWKVAHVASMFGVVTLWVGAWVVWDLVARTGDRSALRRVDHVSQRTGQMGFVLLLVGVVAGLLTAISGGFDLTAPWLIIAYVLLAADLALIRWSTVHVERVRAAQNDEAQDLAAVAASPRANFTLVALVGIWLLLIADMVIKPLT
jgi:hypothetical protein